MLAKLHAPESESPVFRTSNPTAWLFSFSAAVSNMALWLILPLLSVLNFCGTAPVGNDNHLSLACPPVYSSPTCGVYCFYLFSRCIEMEERYRRRYNNGSGTKSIRFLSLSLSLSLSLFGNIYLFPLPLFNPRLPPSHPIPLYWRGTNHPFDGLGICQLRVSVASVQACVSHYIKRASVCSSGGG